MSDESKKVTPSQKVLSKAEERAAALRDNLKKRKAFQQGKESDKSAQK